MAKPCKYYDDNFEAKEGEIVERNGSLRLVRDRNTGEEHWLSPHEVTPIEN